MDPLLTLVVATSIGLLFFTAARHKLNGGRRFEAQLAAYRLLPESLLRPVAKTLPWLELAVAVALLVRLTRTPAALVATTLLLGYALAMAVNIKRGRAEIDCGCGDQPQALSGWLLLRNAVLAIATMSLVAPVTERALGMADMWFMVVLTAALSLTYVMCEQLTRNFSGLSKS
jgi:hypothetical protein